MFGQVYLVFTHSFCVDSLKKGFEDFSADLVLLFTERFLTFVNYEY